MLPASYALPFAIVLVLGGAIVAGLSALAGEAVAPLSGGAAGAGPGVSDGFAMAVRARSGEVGVGEVGAGEVGAGEARSGGASRRAASSCASCWLRTRSCASDS